MNEQLAFIRVLLCQPELVQRRPQQVGCHEQQQGKFITHGCQHSPGKAKG